VCFDGFVVCSVGREKSKNKTGVTSSAKFWWLLGALRRLSGKVVLWAVVRK
jgi:hypothetical protein